MSWGNSGWGNSGWGSCSSPSSPKDHNIWGHKEDKYEKKWGQSGWGNHCDDHYDKHHHHKLWGQGWSEKHNRFEKDTWGHSNSSLGGVLSSVFGLKAKKSGKTGLFR